ncbi:PBSX family phage terminase large subunit [Caminicella sporogenes]|uniref:PBSX family phage terminase large subunit n=1 Tax=Caminicella sporogenes TaxID=166485 RepID=UPI00253F914B|nr:PBSX family phage terminase large subunit [Caminicella sporogenes]WIF95034.1 PBSX family phage terminase large subunit [Caminicella sporogenes]
MKIKIAPFKFKPFSLKQKKVLTWWMDESSVKDKDAIICDGSVRAGKTVVMSLSFVIWAMETFNQENLAMAGKTIGSLRRNVIGPLKKMLKSRGYKYQDKRADNLLIIKKGNKVNYFYLFGGKDESSQDLIQGITLAGMFFDEVALMPESFVNQATARCSVEGAKLWFNCNPEGPYHWFKIEWLDKLEEKNAIHIHFTMDDNPSLSEKVKERYRRMYSGVFFKRYILGLWVVAEGLIYDMFSEEKHVKPTIEREYLKYYISIDYGTYNVTAFGLWGLCTDGKWYKIKEYYYDGRNSGKQKTDEEYYKDLEKFAGDLKIQRIIIDPSAASFIACIKKHGRFKVKKADNSVLDGIRNVSTALEQELIYYNDCCKETFKEIHSYTWDEKAIERGEDKPKKENDHHMDADRYFVRTVIFKGQGLKILK